MIMRIKIPWAPTNEASASNDREGKRGAKEMPPDLRKGSKEGKRERHASKKVSEKKLKMILEIHEKTELPP